MFFVNALRAVRTRYQLSLRERPLTTNILQSFLLWTIGDVMSQTLEQASAPKTLGQGGVAAEIPVAVLPPDTNGTERFLPDREAWTSMSKFLSNENRFDYQRCWFTALYGGVFIGPVGHQWYKGLDFLAGKLFSPKSSAGAFLVTKVALDTLVFGPIHVTAFFTWMKLLGGGSLDDLRKKLGDDFLPTFVVDSFWWVPIQVLNFKFVPVPIQLTVVNVACIFESAGLSFLNHAGWNSILPPMYL